jgi:2-keto-3-deoxy-L-fuconate dehydrogenase
MDLVDFRAVITGGASGIGLATAVALRRRGADVVCLDRNASEPALPTIECDVRDRHQVEEAIADAGWQLGGIDGLVNCAGVPLRGPLDDVDDGQALEVLDINVLGMVRTIRAALPALRRSDRAAVVNMSSMSANIGMAGLSIYSASKGAVLALTRSLAAELIADGVRVNCVSPGTVETPWITRLLDESNDPAALRRTLENRQANAQLVTAEEVASAIVFLLDPAQRSVNGVSLAVDGGTETLHATAEPGRSTASRTPGGHRGQSNGASR